MMEDAMPARRIWSIVLVLSGFLLGAVAIPTLGVTGLALLTSLVVVLGLAMLRWRTEP